MKEGCTWRAIPHDYPNWQNVRYHYDIWAKHDDKGISLLDRILRKLVEAERGIVIFKKFHAYITGKSVKQRVCICVVLTIMLTLLFFTVKANFFDNPETPQTSVSEYDEYTESSTENGTYNTEENYEPPKFHISLIDVGVLLAVIAAYSIHKIREKRKQRRM